MNEKQPRLSPVHKEILHNINALPKDERSLLLRSNMNAVDDKLATTFDTGRWLEEMIAFRAQLEVAAGAKK